jgi:hypothetical protein
MQRSGIARHLAIVTALTSGGCGLRAAGTAPVGRDASQAGDAGGGNGDGGGGERPPIGIISDGGNSDAPGGSSPDANCGVRSKTAARIPPDVFIVLDRSGSMNDDINNRPCAGAGGCGPTSKWALMVPAITSVVGETEAEVNWGLKLFPEDITPVCTVSPTRPR